MTSKKKGKSAKNEIAIFCYKSMPVRTVEVDGDTWFVAKDVCDILELANSRMAVQELDEDEKGVSKTDTPGGVQEMTIISEAGLYTLLMRSNKPEAKPFRRWVTHEVLPSIRKTGSYSIPNASKQGKTCRMSRKVIDAAEKICQKAFACQSQEDFRDTIALDNVFKNSYGKSALEMAGISLAVKDERKLYEEWDSDGCHLFTREVKYAYTWEHSLLPPLPEGDLHMWYEDREAK